MAKKVDATAIAAKRRQQIIILSVGGVLLAGLLMIQGPKVLHHGKKSSATAASTSTTSSTATDTTTTGTSGTTDTSSPAVTPTVTTPAPSATITPTAAANGPAAKVAGIILRSAGAPHPATGQLWTLSRFKAHDPFIQQVIDKSATAGASGSSGSAGANTTPGAGPATGGKTGGASVVVPSTATPAAFAYVTVMVNGRPQQLTLKDVFPKGQPTFVVRSVDKRFVTIGVAGGRFVGGAVVKLELGKAVTLMNTATGQRFVMKLVYTGSQPEQIAGFKAPATPATPAAAAPAATKPAAPKA